MNVFRFRKDDQSGEAEATPVQATTATKEAPTEREGVAGERGITSVNRVRSLQSRVSSLLALGLMSVLGVSLLGWYYARVAARPAQAQRSVQTAAKQRAQGEMPLPALGRIEPPSVHIEPVHAEEASVSVVDVMLGPAPALPSLSEAERASEAPSASDGMSAGSLPPDRRLSGPVFAANGAREMSQGWGQEPADTHAASPTTDLAAMTSSGDVGALAVSLKPTTTSAVRAQVLPTRRLLLPKGAFLDCTLETAIDSTLPGMTTCVLASDTFSADGTVVLLERGTKLVGETSGQVAQGAARLFVLWTQARTPTGVVVALASPGTDELGRSGLAGEVNRHFWQRFGAAILVSVIDGAVQSAVQSSNDTGTVVYSPSTSQSIMTEVLKGTINIPPTITKKNGERIQVLVARDLDFRSVYELRAVAHQP